MPQEVRCWAMAPIRSMIVLIALILAPVAAGAISPPLPGSDAPRIDRPIEYLEDPSGQLTIDEVTGKKGLFTPLDAPIPSFGLTSSAYWLRVSVTNGNTDTATAVLAVRCPWLDDGRLYQSDGKGSFTEERFGDRLPFDNRKIVAPHFLFTLDLPPGETTYYLRLRSDDPLMAPLTLHTPESLQEEERWLGLYYGVVFGAALVIMVYNGLLYLSLRERAYALYVLYLVAFIMMNASYNGLAFQYLWPSAPTFANWSISLFIYLFLIVGLLFTTEFLNLGASLPRYARTVRWLIGGLVCLFVATGAAGYGANAASSLVAVPLYSFFVLWVTAHSLLRGNRAARYFLVGSLSGALGITVSAAAVAAAIDYSFWLHHAVELGFLGDVVFLSIALADKIGIYRFEKEKAESQMRSVLQRSKDELERAVIRRTKELEREKQKAERATQLKDQFVRLVSHDLRSSLGGIISLVGILQAPKRFTLSDERREELLSRINNTVRSVITMIERLLNVDRLKEGSIVPQYDFFALRPVVEDVCNTLQHVAERKGIAMRNEVAEDTRLFADPNLFREIIHNLIDNGVKFLSTGERVIVRFERNCNDVVIVEDTGPGIDPSVASGLFEGASHSLPGSAGEKGSGQGLPHCRELVAAHRGGITFASKPDRGASFMVSIPHVTSILLLVDDQAERREEIKQGLFAWGSHIGVIEADCGEKALKILERRRPDVVISDIEMPGMNGLSLLERMKSDNRLASIPVALISSALDETDSDNEELLAIRERAFALGALDCIARPVDDEGRIALFNLFGSLLLKDTATE